MQFSKENGAPQREGKLVIYPKGLWRGGAHNWFRNFCCCCCYDFRFVLFSNVLKKNKKSGGGKKETLCSMALTSTHVHRIMAKEYFIPHCSAGSMVPWRYLEVNAGGYRGKRRCKAVLL